MRLVAAVAVMCCLAASSAFAQAASIRRAPVRKPPIGVRVYGFVESETLKATKSFDAVVGTSRFMLAGAGGDVINLWRGAFARAAVSTVKEEGTRVFVSGTNVVSLGIPVTITMTPIEIGGGWRFAAFDRKRRVVPYAGATGLFLQYKESSQFADSSENTDTIFNGSAVFGGVDVAIKFVRVAVEAVYRHVPNALGAGGVSQSFSENNLGGGVIRLAVGVGF